MAKERTVARYIEEHENWKLELETLKKLVESHDLQESIKWGSPVYTYKNKNVLGISAFKQYVGFWFFQGGLLKDKAQKLVNAQEGKTQAMRQWRFNNQTEIIEHESLINNYIEEAISNVKAGKEIKANIGKPLIIPHQLQAVIDENEDIKVAFNALNLTRKRDFAEYIATAKQDKTKVQRLEKILPMIIAGIGLNDKYK